MNLYYQYLNFGVNFNDFRLGSVFRNNIIIMYLLPYAHKKPCLNILTYTCLKRKRKKS